MAVKIELVSCKSNRKPKPGRLALPVKIKTKEPVLPWKELI